jgi:antitoxin component YwqK of YwqJK toxin-antitoxin module
MKNVTRLEKKGIIVAGSLALILLIQWGWNEKSFKQPDSNVVATKDQLALRNGRLYLTNHTQPFNGIMIERFPNGGIQSRSAISNGLLNGLSEGYASNGCCVIREHFKDGVSHGLRTKWYDNAAKLSEADIIDGKIHGTFRRWHENGALAEQMSMQNGQPDGICFSYYSSGCLKAQAKLENGKLVSQQFFEDGQRKP